jgi:hypothetical protein
MPSKSPNIYIYGIVKEPGTKEFSLRGLDDAPVYMVNFQDLAAVVSDREPGEVDPTRRNVLAHTIVQDELLKIYTLLPMGFGMVTTDRTNVVALLQKNYDALFNELNRLAGKVEAELKLFWDEKSLAAQNQELINKLKNRISRASSPTEAQRLSIEAGMQVESIAKELKTRYADKVYATLKGMASETRLNAPGGIKNLLNASFLIERSRENEFVEQVRRMDASCEGKVNFKYVGPLSPYNFVAIKLEPVAS